MSGDERTYIEQRALWTLSLWSQFWVKLGEKLFEGCTHTLRYKHTQQLIPAFKPPLIIPSSRSNFRASKQPKHAWYSTQNKPRNRKKAKSQVPHFNECDRRRKLFLSGESQQVSLWPLNSHHPTHTSRPLSCWILAFWTVYWTWFIPKCPATWLE